MTQQPLFIVMNAGSGDKDAEEREATIRRVLSDAGRPYRLWSVSESGKLPAVAREAVELARQQKGIVVAAGGDGTINAVCQVVHPAGVAFGVLPQGTFNYFSRSHGIPVDTEEATKLLLTGVLRPVQVGLLNDRLFLVNGSIGLYPKLLEKREAHKQKFGRTRLVAMLSALVTVLTPPPRLVLTLEEGARFDRLSTNGERFDRPDANRERFDRLSTNGDPPSPQPSPVRPEPVEGRPAKEVIHVSTVLVENNPLQLEEVGLPEASEVRHGQLAAVIVKAKGIPQMLSVMASAALGRLRDSENVDSFSFTSLTVNPVHRRRVKVATDGEVTWMDPPLVFRVAPRPLLLVLPPSPPTERS